MCGHLHWCGVACVARCYALDVSEATAACQAGITTTHAHAHAHAQKAGRHAVFVFAHTGSEQQAARAPQAARQLCACPVFVTARTHLDVLAVAFKIEAARLLFKVAVLLYVEVAPVENSLVVAPCWRRDVDVFALQEIVDEFTGGTQCTCAGQHLDPFDLVRGAYTIVNTRRRF